MGGVICLIHARLVHGAPPYFLFTFQGSSVNARRFLVQLPCAIKCFEESAGHLEGNDEKATSSSVSRRHGTPSRPRSTDSIASIASIDSDHPAAFVPLPSFPSSNNIKGGRDHLEGAGDRGVNQGRRRMASPPPPTPLVLPAEGFPPTGGGVAGAGGDPGSRDVAESGGKPASAEGGDGKGGGRPGPSTPSPPKMLRSASRDVRVVEGKVGDTLTARADAGSEVKGVSAEAAQQRLPSATPLSSALATKPPDAIDGLSRGGGAGGGGAAVAASSRPQVFFIFERRLNLHKSPLLIVRFVYRVERKSWRRYAETSQVSHVLEFCYLFCFSRLYWCLVVPPQFKSYI